MSTKLKSVVSLVAGMAMLMSVGVGTAMTAGAAEAQTLWSSWWKRTVARRFWTKIP